MRSALLFASLVISHSLSTLAAAAETVAPQVPEGVKQLMQDRNYPEAIKAIDAAAKLKDAPLDYLGYLKARALHLAGKFDDAQLAYEKVEKEHTKSPWARQARFGKADEVRRGAEGIPQAHLGQFHQRGAAAD